MPPRLSSRLILIIVVSLLLLGEDWKRLNLNDDEYTWDTPVLTTRDPTDRVDYAAFVRESPLNVFEGLSAKVFRKWATSSRLPCFPAPEDWRDFERQNNGAANTGFLFMRPLKTGSTSTISIILRLASRLAQRFKIDSELCNVRFTHGYGRPALAERFAQRQRAHSYLWTILRDPTRRVVSQFYFFQVSRYNRAPTDDAFLDYLASDNRVEDYYLRILSTSGYAGRAPPHGAKVARSARDAVGARRKHGARHGQAAVQSFQATADPATLTAQAILQEYDFIGITERYDESAVALAMLLGLDLADILYLKVKTAGSFDFAWKQCIYLYPSYVSPAMHQYFQSPEWQERIRYDAALYRAANRSLDLTIDAIGRQAFADNLQRYEAALAVVEQKCADTVVFRCTEGGEVVDISSSDCLWDNAACGMSCLDQVADELGLSSVPIVNKDTPKAPVADTSDRIAANKIKETPTKTKSPYAYVFMIGGCDPDRPKYRNYLYGVYVAAALLRERGSISDILLFVELYSESPYDELPDNELAALAQLDIQVRYIPKEPNPSFYRIQLHKFRVLGLTEYRRVMYLDADVMPLENLDYLLRATDDGGPLQPNLVVRGKYAPANGGIFILAPQPGDLERINSLIQQKERANDFSLVDGWGAKIQWKGLDKTGTEWDFNAASGDQGLLYYWTLFVQKSVSVVIEKGKVQNWRATGPSGAKRATTIQQPFGDPDPIACWPKMQQGCDNRPWSDLVHFTWDQKPWFRGYPMDLSSSTKTASPIHFWFAKLEELNNRYRLGLYVRGIRDERNNKHPGVSESRTHIGTTLTNLLD